MKDKKLHNNATTVISCSYGGIALSFHVIVMILLFTKTKAQLDAVVVAFEAPCLDVLLGVTYDHFSIYLQYSVYECEETASSIW